MEFQRIINLLDNTNNQPSKLGTKNWVEGNDGARRVYKRNNEIVFKTTILNSSLCDYSDSYIFLKGTMAFVGQRVDTGRIAADRNNNQVILNKSES